MPHERYTFDFSRDDGLGGSVLLELHPDGAWYRADVIEPDHGPVVVRDFEVPLPRGDSLSVRADGLWSDLVCETPFEHWSFGLEAFGLRLDDAPEPDAAWDSVVGERLPVGFDLEWEHVGPPVALADGSGYAQRGTVHGEILVVRDRIAVEVPAVRDHWWGSPRGGRPEASRLDPA